MIRGATAFDAGRLAEIEVTDYRLFFYPIFKTDGYFFGELTVEALTNDYREHPEKLENTFVYDDGIIKGFIRVNGGELEKLFVEPAFQAEGVGGELIEYALAHAEPKRLLVLEKNARAIKFYEKHGFYVTNERQRVDDTDELFIVMRR